MTTPISPARPAGWYRGRSGILIVVLAIVAAAFVVIAVVRWEGSSDAADAPAAPSVLMPAAAPPASGVGMPDGTGANLETETHRSVAPSRPSCETIAYPTYC